jgi:hypothetical protein
VDEGVELAVLAAGIDAGGKVGEQRLVEAAADEGGIELVGIDADEDRLEAGVDELAGEGGGVTAPERKQGAAAGAGQPALTVGAHVLEEEVPEGDRGDPVERGSAEREPAGIGISTSSTPVARACARSRSLRTACMLIRS